MNNNEWFNQLSIEDKAEWFYCVVDCHSCWLREKCENTKIRKNKIQKNKCFTMWKNWLEQENNNAI